MRWALATALDRLPRTLLLYAVEAADASLGVGLSPAIEAGWTTFRRVVDECRSALRRQADRL